MLRSLRVLIFCEWAILKSAEVRQHGILGAPRLPVGHLLLIAGAGLCIERMLSFLGFEGPCGRILVIWGRCTGTSMTSMLGPASWLGLESFLLAAPGLYVVFMNKGAIRTPLAYCDNCLCTGE